MICPHEVTYTNSLAGKGSLLSNQTSVDKMSQQVAGASQRDEIIRRAKARAFACEECSGCCQRALQAIQRELGIGSKETFRAATVLAGGLLHGESCGALIGALMALGLVLGNDKKEVKRLLRE